MTSTPTFLPMASGPAEFAPVYHPLHKPQQQQQQHQSIYQQPPNLHRLQRLQLQHLQQMSQSDPLHQPYPFQQPQMLMDLNLPWPHHFNPMISSHVAPAQVESPFLVSSSYLDRETLFPQQDDPLSSHPSLPSTALPHNPSTAFYQSLDEDSSSSSSSPSPHSGSPSPVIDYAELHAAAAAAAASAPANATAASRTIDMVMNGFHNQVAAGNKTGRAHRRRGPVPSYIVYAESIAQLTKLRALAALANQISPSPQGKKEGQCANCATKNTSLWRRGGNNECLCNACGLYYRLHRITRPIELKTDVIKKRNRKEYPAKNGKMGKQPATKKEEENLPDSQ